MSGKFINPKNVVEVVAGVLAVMVGAHQLLALLEPEEIVSPSSRFYCSLQADSERGGEVWTVMYRYSQDAAKPWLRMVREMGGGYDTQTRCEKIADRLEIFREDGLLGFEYRAAPETPNQFVLCAKTQLSGDNCPLVLTLMPEDNPYESLRSVMGALLPGTLPTYQGSEQASTGKPYEISLTEQLVEEDR